MSRLKQEGALLDVRTNNCEVPAWLADVANTRIHVTTGQAPSVLLEAERAHLQGLAPAWRGAISGARPTRTPDQAKQINQINQTDTHSQPVEFKAASEIEPIDVQQHPPAVFDALLRQIQTQARMQTPPQTQPLWVGA